MFKLPLALLSATSLLLTTAFAEPLKLNGSTTVNLPVAEAAEVLRAEKKMEIQLDTFGGSAGGISQLAEGKVQIGMSSKPVTDAEREKFPAVKFVETRIGQDAVAVIVSKDVWEGGVKELSKGQLKGIYESTITNWKEVGGPDKRIAFFNKEPGRGTWEVFVHWVYGNSKLAPEVSFPEVGGNEETRTKVASTKGAISQLSYSWVDNKTTFAVAVKDGDAPAVAALAENIANGSYPLSRPLYLLTNGEPTGDAKTFIDFVLSDRGQVFVKKHGYLPLAELKKS